MQGSNRLLLAAGLVTWAMAGVPTLSHGLAEHVSWSFALWCIAFLTFGVAFCAMVFDVGKGRWDASLLGLESVAALCCIALGSGGAVGFTGILLAVVGGQLPFVLGLRTATLWVLVQSLVLALLFAWGGDGHWLTIGGYAGFQLFALGAGHVARRESDARRELAATHAELVATQALLAESARERERLRISRELHDSAGHHLTALSLQLELAKNAEGEQAKAAVVKARAIAGELLGEVRDTVRALRETRQVELEPALQALAQAASGLKVTIRVDPELQLDSDTAHALFRCAQEAVTNALRHSSAQHLTLDLCEVDEAAVLTVKDDGRGAAELRPGSGLSGLRERLEILGGEIQLETSPGRGFRLVASVPGGST
ncbi:MAG: sensor histidine kinase [Polyangiaceae bacterium]|nr:sensor histidine kinase [Polyangiaceae bacterium]